MPRKPAKPGYDKELEQTQSERLSYSFRQLKEACRERSKYERYVKGDPPPKVTDRGPGRTDEKLLTEAQLEARALGKGWINVTVPLHGLTLAAIKPSLVSKAATWEDHEKPLPEGADPEAEQKLEIERGQNRIFRELAKQIDQHSDIKRQLRSSVEDATYGNGWLFTDFDTEHGIMRIRWANAERVMVDLEADSDPVGDLQQWRALCKSYPLDKAQYLLKNVWGKGENAWAKKDHQFEPVQHAKNDYTDQVEEMPTKFVNIVHVYVRANNPYTSEADLDVEPGKEEEPVGDDPVYKGRSECLIFEAVGPLEDEQSYKFIARYPNPLPVEFPLIPLMLLDDNKRFYKPAIYQQSHSMCVATNAAIRNYNTKLFQLTRMIMGYDPQRFTKKTFEKVFFGPDALNLVEFKGGDISRAFEALKMGEVPKELAEGIANDKALFDEVSQREIFEIEQRSHQPATNAALQDAQKQLRLDDMADRVERAYQEVMNAAVCGCRMLMTAEQVASWVGDEYMGWYDDNGVQKSKYWDETISDPRAVRMMVDMRIEPRSVRFVSPEQQIADLERYTTRVNEYASTVQKANEANPQLAAALADVFNAALEEYADLLRLPKRRRVQFDLKAVLTPPTPEPQQMPEQTTAAEMGPDGSISMEQTGPAPDAAEQFKQILAGRGMDVAPEAGDVGP